MKDYDNLENDFIGYCSSCKNIITEEDDYVKELGSFYCLSCYKRENNIEDELYFGE